MRKLFTFLVAVLLTSTVFAQAPQKMSYQAVIRNNNGDLVVNQSVKMRISIQKYIFGFPPSYQNVYVETHTATTNENGLVSLKIGGGTVVSGVFSNIDWSDGEYYIKTETDPTGGTNYTITGTSQLLSVPYALYAKTADSTRGHYVGEFYGGGVVFWVDETGQHGLICAKSNQNSGVPLSSGVPWNSGPNTYTMARGDGLKAGFMNTAIIIANQGNGNGLITYAARICNELQITEGGITYGDWYLPSKYELSLMYQNKAIINATALANGGSAFDNAIYWSSTEYNETEAFQLDFVTGITAHSSKGIVNFRVRAIRAF